MSRSRTRGNGRRALLPIVLAGTAALAISGAGTATAGTNGDPDAVIQIRGAQENMHFAPRVTDIPSGGLLKIRNRTGQPHTLSLVEREDVPDTGAEIRNCYFGICGLIFEAHKKEKPGPGFGKVVDNGLPGLDTPFSTNPETDGDSVYVGKHPREINVSKAPGETEWFMCAIHPSMHGRINAQP